ncbi:hybrid PKS-NRPS PsoA [Periconia macrospinosa]|uniref:Hybrid PKS-NRPS PsoA n=1 Tax=Periconia macrospinosa TaxID=97972 RepID=A0A2V1DDE0_9PLEO|nr:hybrid PKS-NRPS PsoA [Periconia macrospinosa]
MEVSLTSLFGGANAHAIVESWEPVTSKRTIEPSPAILGPLVLSANTPNALAATIAGLSEALKRKDNIHLEKLAWTLQTRRSEFTHRASFIASSKEKLIDQLDIAARDKKHFSFSTKAVKIKSPRLLGVFTGQGAQWATMGAGLYVHSAHFRKTISTLEAALIEIPSAPQFSLSEELLRQDDPTRTASAEISQPLCTALQVALVDLLKECGIVFSAVVGHSSGEIAAAYAAGVINATDAILIAYYRGYHSHATLPSDGKRGKMMSVGMAASDAEDFCQQPRLRGKIVVAAKNSATSVTLSGDADAIEEAKQILDAKTIFNRILVVDKAYHSHHMELIRGPYLQSLQRSNIRPLRDCFEGACNWYSSVYPPASNVKTTERPIEFAHEYWTHNLTNPVLFHDAVTAAVQVEHFDLALEVGPHPALRGPARESIQNILNQSLPYHGVLERGKDAVEAFSSALGFIWRNIDSPTPLINFAGFLKACNGPEWVPPPVQNDLPSYPWDHDRPIISESRRAKQWRTRSTPHHELLGRPDSNGGTHEVRWRNILKLKDVEWLQGHQFQHQVLLPAAGYLTMAIDASLHLVGDAQPVKLLELQDVVIHNGITLEEGSPGVEIHFTIRLVEENATMKASEFSCRYSNASASSPDLEKLVLTGRVLLELGLPSRDTLPERVLPSLPMSPVSIARFYPWISKIGLQYSGPFKLDAIQRRLNVATVTTTRTEPERNTIHPGTLDSILQGLYAAFSFPGDGRVWTAYLPKSFRRARFNMHRSRQAVDNAESKLVADIRLSDCGASSILGDIDVFAADDGHPEMQFEDVMFSALEVPSEANDRKMFWHTTWERQIQCPEWPHLQIATSAKIEMHEVCERIAYFYLKYLGISTGGVSYTHWDNDSHEYIRELVAKHPDVIDLEFMQYLGSKPPSARCGSGFTLEETMLETLYTTGMGFAETKQHLGEILKRLSHQYPQMRALEIGAGQGATTSIALERLATRFQSYTITDPSTTALAAIERRFAANKKTLRYKPLDIEQSPTEQGFQAYTYDLVIAAHILHTTTSLSQTLQNCRELLRPGGHLVILDIMSMKTLRVRLFSSFLPRSLQTPTNSDAQWNAVLQQNLFSGVDHVLQDFEDNSMHAFSTILSQAVDERVNVLRHPLDSAGEVQRSKNLLIVGGRTLTVSKMAAKLTTQLDPFFENISTVSELNSVTEGSVAFGTDVICLSGLEETTFFRMDHGRLSAMQSLFRAGRFMLWATRGCDSGDPYSGIVVGLARTASREMAHLRLKLVDVGHARLQKLEPEATMFSEKLLQMMKLDSQANSDILWSNETEVAVIDGSVFIPRVVPDLEANRSFNAARRQIMMHVPAATKGVEIVKGEASGMLKLSPQIDVQTEQDLIRVQSSSFFKFVCSDSTSQGFYICLGYSNDKSQRILGFSTSNGSTVTTIPGCSFPWSNDVDAGATLSAVLSTILCKSLLSHAKGTVWVHNADSYTTQLIREEATAEKISIFLTTSQESARSMNGEIKYIHPLVTDRQLRLIIPQDVGRFVNLGQEESNRLVGFSKSFPKGAVEIQPELQHMKSSQNVSVTLSMSELIRMLQAYSDDPNLMKINTDRSQHTITSVENIYEQRETAPATNVVTWVDVQSIPIQVVPASSQRLFRDDKTYFLVGLTGDLGLSLCEWMVDHGARYFALASRNPDIAPQSMSHLEGKGAVIRVFSLDIGSMQSLREVHENICATMPSIAGVANAALVVRDHPFDGISLHDLEAGFKPKVVGSTNLDQLFHSTQLEFFILFGSVATVVGKPGQCNYNAANVFQSALALRRRKRGLAASIIHFGMLLGLGFVHGKADPKVEEKLLQDDLPGISETDFHANFAQAVLCGLPGASTSHEVISGLGNEIETTWRAMPRFSHCRINADEQGSEGLLQNSTGPSRSIHSRLENAKDDKEALLLLKVAFSERVAVALGRPGADIDENTALISLGLDSLIAVEIRSWLLKVLEVDVPVLKLLGGSSLLSLCHDVLKKITPEDPELSNVTKKTDVEEADSSSYPVETKSSSVSSATNDLPSTPTTESEVPGWHMLNTDEVSSCDASPAPSLVPTHQVDYERIGDMSHAQSQLYFLHEYLHNNAHNVAYSGRFHGQLNIKDLEEALRVVGKRHEAMRSAYFIDKSTAKPVQAVLREPRIVLTHKTISGDREPQAVIDGIKDYAFDIENGVVMKVTVLTKSSSLHYITFNHHHIALDGFSWGIFLTDLAQTYPGRPGVSSIQQSIEMAKRQLELLTPPNLDPVLTFWKNVYKTFPQPLPLFPFAKVTSRPIVKDFIVHTSVVELPSTLTRRVEMATSELGVTGFHFHLATLATFLARCLQISDVAIGVVDANRTEAQDMSTVGYFLNMLPVRVPLQHTESFKKVAKRSRDVALAAMTQSYAPLDLVLGGVGASPSTDHHPLFQVAINYRKGALNETDFGPDSKIEWDSAVPGGHPYDFLLDISTSPRGTRISLVTQRSLYNKSDGTLLLNWYTRALEALALDTNCEVGRCPISNETDILEAIKLGQGSKIDIIWEGTLIDRIGKITAQFPEHVAVKDSQGCTLTYTQVAERARQVRHNIRTSPQGCCIATLLDPVADTVCSILAVMQLGLIWVPLDTRNHQQRLRAIVEESKPHVLLCHEATRHMAQEIVAGLDNITIVSVDDMPPEIVNAGGDEAGRGNGISKTDPAMILYTSGSTGVPKGVVLTQGGLVNQTFGTIAHLQLGRETTLQHSPLGFDLMLDQMFLALCNGGTVIMAGKTERGDPTELAKLMVQHGVTLTHFVPSEYLGLLNYGYGILKNSSTWRFAMSGGEKLTQKLRGAFHKLACPNLNLVNVYGPAEITLACARGIIPNDELIDGSTNDHLRSSPNYDIEIRDSEMNLLPLGFPGEICISGPGVGLGYLHRSEETTRKFIDYTNSENIEARLYRSGDKGRILHDGSLQVLGRIDGDTQVKINGFRVELDEIANAIVIASEGAIVNAAVSLRSAKTSNNLVAFVVFGIDFVGNRTTFLSRLQNRLPLPPIMTPAIITSIEKIPATANGKTDRRAVDALFVPERTDRRSSISGTRRVLSPREHSVKEVWEEVLGVSELDGIDSDSDFFQVGGTSIHMIKLKSVLKVQFGTTFSMPSLFHTSTLKGMANLIANATGNAQGTRLAPPKMSFLGSRKNQQAVDWDLEIAGLVDGLDQPRPTPAPPKREGLIVVLTGATGFIGNHLLSRLVQDPRIAQVHCISIRPDANGEARHVAVKSPKVVEYSGDLSALNLGLSDSLFVSLAESVDIIIHNGADVSLLKTYQSLRRANVMSTRRLCEMAIPRQVPIHFVSTASVAKVVEHQPLLEEAAAVINSRLDSVDGYAASKWASEALLERVAEDNGLPVYIHRLAHVVGDNASELDAVGMLTKYSLELGAFPRIETDDVIGKWDFVTAEECVGSMISTAIVSATAPSPHIMFTNHCNDEKVPHENFQAHLEDMAGGKSLRQMEMMGWLAEASKKGLHPLVREFFAAFNEGRGKLDLPLIARSS